ncbi:MAG: Endonuclease III [candidate division WS6 bacterium GW2011_GWA2_37_6]|uniref:Endonuclease III n=1 Tax=candidate division WS6 bacterium GW2011_GWA2_37_6 TaxID=1619087 RepID=A0A0G0JCC7_9BACT|nr:MAG: Endonuclease III [candidate division WS6 bacterium GW2011_GWA2_37_6]
MTDKNINKKNEKQARKNHTDEILLRLKGKYPIVRSALNYSNALELLVATILSAQCTDARVNMVTPILFKKYKTTKDYAQADLNELKTIIHSTGFYNNKAKHLKKLGKMLNENYNGKVPDSIEKLIKLPGVARKTANVVLFGWFGKNEGIPVDTHVKRVTSRLGLTKEINPEKIEKDLIKIIPRKELGPSALRFIEHGRAICKARKPDCKNCLLNDICPSAFKV